MAAPYDVHRHRGRHLGMYQLHRLRGLGLCVRVFEAGDGVGAPGTGIATPEPGRLRVVTYGYSFRTRSCASGSGASTRGPAGDAALLQLRGRQARPAPRHRVRLSNQARSTTRPPASGEIESEDGRRARARFLITAIGPCRRPPCPRSLASRASAERRTTRAGAARARQLQGKVSR